MHSCVHNNADTHIAASAEPHVHPPTVPVVNTHLYCAEFRATLFILNFVPIQLYKVFPEERSISSLENSVVTRMVIKDVT